MNANGANKSVTFTHLVKHSNDENLKKACACLQESFEHFYAQTSGKWMDVIAYGSLMWHRAFECKAVQPMVLSDWKASFCVCSTLWRGSTLHPGLVLGAQEQQGEQLLAVRLTIARNKDFLWEMWVRELTGGQYCAQWLQQHQALIFSANTQNALVKNFALEEQKKMLSTGVGLVGSSAQYLQQYVQSLREHHPSAYEQHQYWENLWHQVQQHKGT